MYVFIDTEFTGLFRREDRHLISFGAASIDGHEFYVELSDTWQRAQCDPWVLNNVIPLMDGGHARLSLAEASERLADWIEEFAEPVVMVSDAPDYDWPLVHQLLSTRWPANLARLPIPLIVSSLDDPDGYEAALERVYAAGLRRHHALDDARANRLAWLAAGGPESID